MSITVFALLAWLCGSVYGRSPRSEQIEMILATVRRVTQLAERNVGPVDKQDIRDIAVALRHIQRPSDFTALAEMLWAIVMTSDPFKEDYDSVFMFAIWHCVDSLAVDPSPRARSGLIQLKRSIGYDGDGAATIRRALRKQAGLQGGQDE